MAKTNWQDPRTGEIISPHISGLQEAVGKLEESIGIETITETNMQLSEVFISGNDRYRIYQAPEGKRNWLISPAPIIKKNGVNITNDFEIDYGGGAVVFTNPITESDVLTADVKHTIKTENVLTKQDYASKSEAEVGADNTKVMTPLKVREFFIANGGGSGGVTNVVFQSGKKYYKFTATDAVNNFEIPSELFNPANDVVELIHGGNIPLIKDENYTLVGNLVTFIGYSLDIGDDIHCLITNTAYSYNALSDKPDLSNIVRYSEAELGTPISVNANTLGGQLPSYYAKSDDFSNTNNKVGVLETNIEEKTDKDKVYSLNYEYYKNLPSGADLNEYKNPNVYAWTSNSIPPTLINAPTELTDSGAYGKLIVEHGRNYYDLILQTLKFTKSKKSYEFVRYFASDIGWCSWQEIATTEKIDILLTANTGYKITHQECYKINNLIFINARFKKSDDGLFTDIHNPVMVATLPYMPKTFNVQLSTVTGIASGSPAISNSSAYISLTGTLLIMFKKITYDCDYISVSGSFAI